MKYHEIYQRVIRVLESCETDEQIKMGRKYCHMLLNNHIDIDLTQLSWIIDHYMLKHEVKRRNVNNELGT